ncbi:hypothetical protein [Pseudomonas sp. FYR_7]|uniref:hypothetical protein n=1 Tax=Pseudomonas sp. FYR_7 TaxID=3367174 RepID=UPI00370BAAB2
MRVTSFTLIAAFTFSVAGCYSPGELIRKGPTYAAQTAKPPKQYALCVFPQWQESRPDATMSETENGYRLLSGNDMNTNEILQISKTPGGSDVKFYQRSYLDFGAGRATALESTKSCL